jgi:hypothetical protein
MLTRRNQMRKLTEFALHQDEVEQNLSIINTARLLWNKLLTCEREQTADV